MGPKSSAAKSAVLAAKASALAEYKGYTDAKREKFNNWTDLAKRHSTKEAALNRLTCMRHCTKPLEQREHSQRTMTAAQENEFRALIKMHNDAGRPLSRDELQRRLVQFFIDNK